MLKLKNLMISALFVVAANTYAMQQENDDSRIQLIDNTEYVSEDSTVREARLVALEQRRQVVKRHLEAGMDNIDTAEKARLARKIATKHCLPKQAHKLFKKTRQLEDEEAGWQPNMLGRNIFQNYNSDSDSE